VLFTYDAAPRHFDTIPGAQEIAPESVPTENLHHQDQQKEMKTQKTTEMNSPTDEPHKKTVPVSILPQ
jgi:hypothetical protein